MSEPVMLKVVAPIDEIELMKALDMCVFGAKQNVMRPLEDCEIARAVNWLHAKYGGGRND